MGKIYDKLVLKSSMPRSESSRNSSASDNDIIQHLYKRPAPRRNRTPLNYHIKSNEFDYSKHIAALDIKSTSPHLYQNKFIQKDVRENNNFNKYNQFRKFTKFEKNKQVYENQQNVSNQHSKQHHINNEFKQQHKNNDKNNELKQQNEIQNRMKQFKNSRQSWNSLNNVKTNLHKSRQKTFNSFRANSGAIIKTYEERKQNIDNKHLSNVKKLIQDLEKMLKESKNIEMTVNLEKLSAKSNSPKSPQDKSPKGNLKVGQGDQQIDFNIINSQQNKIDNTNYQFSYENINESNERKNKKGNQQKTVKRKKKKKKKKKK